MSGLHLIHCGFCSQALGHLPSSKKSMVELLVEPGVLDSGLGDNESRGGGGRLQRRSFALCSARKTRCHHRAEDDGSRGMQKSIL